MQNSKYNHTKIFQFFLFLVLPLVVLTTDEICDICCNWVYCLVIISWSNGVSVRLICCMSFVAFYFSFANPEHHLQKMWNRSNICKIFFFFCSFRTAFTGQVVIGMWIPVIKFTSIKLLVVHVVSLFLICMVCSWSMNSANIAVVEY